MKCVSLQLIFMYIVMAMPVHQAKSQTKRVLFLGNSYTGVNNLPMLFQNVCLSTADSVVTDSNTPGGYTLQGHSTNATSLAKIAAGNWDIVVLQEQSQIPSFTDSEVITLSFPYARKLDSLINAQNHCAETVFYRTWGRKNGDATNCAVWPPVCTYQGMDSLLHLRYMQMAADNNALLSPAGVVWKNLRNYHPEIELYATDGSHPSLAGSYAVACSFYAVILRKDPSLISYQAGLPDSVATIIRNAASAVVYDSLSSWLVGKYDPVSSFEYSLTDNILSTQNNSTNATSYLWDFGDGSYATDLSPSHTYMHDGNYTVTLTATKCGISQQTSHTLKVISQEEHSTSLFPNPVTDQLNIISHSSMEGQSFVIFNMLGQVVGKGKLEKNRTQLSVASLSSGCYSIRFEDALTAPLFFYKTR